MTVHSRRLFHLSWTNEPILSVLAPVLLTATGSVTIFDNVLATAFSTGVCFADHARVIPQLTSSLPLPKS